MDNNTLSSTSKELENDDPLLDTVDSSPSCNSSCIVSHNPTTQTSTSVGSVSPTTQTSTSCGSLNPATQTLTSSGSVNPTTSTPTRCGSLNQNVDNLSCEGKESLSIEISITNTKNVSNEVNENKDVKIKMTDSTDVPCKLNDKKTEPFKEEKYVDLSNYKTLSGKVTDTEDVPDKEIGNVDVSNEMIDNKGTEKKTVSDKLTENKVLSNSDTSKWKDMSDQITNEIGMSKKKDDSAIFTDKLFSKNATYIKETVSSKHIENKSNDISEKEMSNVGSKNKNNSDMGNTTGSQIKKEDTCDSYGNKNQYNACIASKSATKHITKVEENENPLDFSATGKIKIEVQNKESCSLGTPSTSVLCDDSFEKTCALDYTISALNRAQSVTEVSSTSSVNSDLKDSNSLLNNISSVIGSSTVPTDSPCDSSSDMNIGDAIQLKDTVTSQRKSVSKGKESLSVVSERVLNETSTEQSKSNNLSVDQKNKIVLIDTSKILQNTDMLLKDTANLLSNTSDLLSEQYLTDWENCKNNTNTSSIEPTPDTESTSVSGVCNEVSYLSAEEYKSKHKIGSRRSSENVLTYNNPVIQPYLPTSPGKSSPKSVVKRKFCVDEIAEHLAKKRAVVSLGERVKDNSYSSGSDKSSVDTPVKGDKSESNSPVSGEKSNKTSLFKSDSDGNKNKTVGSLKKGNNSGSKGESEKKSKLLKTKKKSPKLSKKADVVSLPSRRIKREASLNASARVNLIYEKDMVSPKSRKHSSSSNSSGGKSSNKSSIKIYRSISTDSTSSKSSKPKYSRSKSFGGASKIKGNKNNCKIKQKIVRKSNKSSSDDSLKSNRKKTSMKDSSGKKVQLTKNGNEKSKKQKIKNTNDRDEKAKKRKSSAETLDVSAKKVKSDTQKSARTHVIDKPKSDYSSSTGTPCVKCCQHTCPQQSRKYWNNKEDGGGQTINEEEKLSENSSSLPLDVTTPYSVQTVQLMEGSPFVVPHGHIGPCHACAAAQGGNLLSTSHSYTLSGIGSLSQMMPYHQAYGGGYPVPFAPSSSTPLPHCGCPSCYPPTTGVYYPQTSTPITHQPLQHEPCMVPPHPVHIANEETEIIDVVGGESDDEDKDSSLENLSPPIKFEKTKKKTSSSLDLIRKKKKKIIVVKKNAKEKFTKTKEQKKVKKKIIKDKKKLKKNVKPKIVKKPQYRKTVPKHGWEFEGHPETRKIMCHSVGSMVERSCYPCIRHIDGDVIHVRDCVLLRSGPRKSDIPYVAKVKAFWEDPISKEMMMSILWYYQPEHIEGGRKPHHLLCELFASKHKDENCVACIEDKGYVLTYAEYCRFMAEQRRAETFFPLRRIVVPESLEEYPGKNKLPIAGVDPNTVYVCRQVYDFKLKRILKNPS